MLQTQISQERKSKGAVKDFLSLLSKGLMLPVAMLPIAGMLLGIGAAIPSIADTISKGAGESQVIVTIGLIIKMPGSIVFNLLPIIFAIAIAITFSKDAGIAGLCAFIGWIVFCAIQYAFIWTYPNGDVQFLWYSFQGTDGLEQFSGIFTSSNIPGLMSLNTSVFGGVMVGLLSAFCYNHFKNTKLPTAFGFFSGVRFVPIITTFMAVLLSILFCAVWPLLGKGLFYAGMGLSSAPAGINSFVYMFLNRCLLPFGLHHVLSNLVYWTPIGGTWDLGASAIVYYQGEYWQAVSSAGDHWWQVLGLSETTKYTGEWGIQFALLNYVGKTISIYPISTGSATDVTQVKLTCDMIFKGTHYLNNGYTFNPGQYTSGMGCFMMFALPAAAFAMLFAAPKGEGRKLAGSITMSAALVSFLTGITEPIEFTFLFLAPWLYWGFHAILSGVMCMTCTMFELYTSFGPHFVGSSLIDLLTVGIIQDAIGGGINCWMVCLIGLAYAPLYYFFFRWAINKFDLPTPGRGTTRLFTKKDYVLAKENKQSGNKASMDTEALKIINAYGGKDNITNVEACFTRLRIQVNDASKVNDNELKSLGAFGVVRPSPKAVHSIFGTKADLLKTKIKEILSNS